MSEADNYATTDNLLARISIHEYAVRPDWLGWLFEREMPSSTTAARILDVGCGPGSLWLENHARVSREWQLTLVDSSPAMTELAASQVTDRARLIVADIQELPFEDDSFDVVVANHMLYHVPDRPRAFSEIARVLVSGGAFHCSTNGTGHTAQIEQLPLPRPLNLGVLDQAFGLESGPPQLEAFFDDVRVERYDNLLRVPEPEPVLAYIRSMETHRDSDDLSAARDVIAAEIERSGAFIITTKTGVISCVNR